MNFNNEALFLAARHYKDKLPKFNKVRTYLSPYLHTLPVKIEEQVSLQSLLFVTRNPLDDFVYVAHKVDDENLEDSIIDCYRFYKDNDLEFKHIYHEDSGILYAGFKVDQNIIRKLKEGKYSEMYDPSFLAQYNNELLLSYLLRDQERVDVSYSKTCYFFTRKCIYVCSQNPIYKQGMSYHEIVFDNPNNEELEDKLNERDLIGYEGI